MYIYLVAVRRGWNRRIEGGRRRRIDSYEEENETGYTTSQK